MSHVTGTVQILAAPLTIVSGSGTTIFNPPQAPGGTKLLMLHFRNANLPAGDRLEIKLGYGIDVFTGADGPDFWTRPVDVYAFPAGVEITYVVGSGGGSVQLDKYGRGERHIGDQDPTSVSNCDPFFQPPAYLEPDYDPEWYCTDPPDWENVATIGNPADIRATVARSVGMIICKHAHTFDEFLSTCSVTLIDTDKVLSAGHCYSVEDAVTGSVIFNYETLADGSRPGGYAPRFYKVKAVLSANGQPAHKDAGALLDYSILVLKEAPVGIPVIAMRPDIPGIGESVFGVHHPNGAVKKLSVPHDDGFAKVIGNTGVIEVPKAFHVSGGSSGSGLFDAAGRVVGVCSRGAPCSGSPLKYTPTRSILADLEPAPPPPVTRDVMIVFDRSGSMSSDDGTGRKKIEAARDAVSLFVQLVRSGTGNRLGLVSFSTKASNPADLAIAPVTAANKSTLIGPAPFSGGKVGALNPSGMTTIGGGLDSARGQMAVAGANPRAILLLTDGLQNTAPKIADIEAGLAGMDVHAIGFGTESSLDGALLTTLTAAHSGKYLRAGGGLALLKFFADAFGNIFENGVLFDPEQDLPANQSSDPIKFGVLGEAAITVVIGWDRTDASLLIEVRTPAGAALQKGSPGTQSDAGLNWAYLRVPLPVGAERDGIWSARVLRPGGGEIPPPSPALRYFINIIPSGGPRLIRSPDPAPRTHWYTGDPINPLVMLRYDDGDWPAAVEVSLTVTRPDNGAGNILSKLGLGSPAVQDADAIDARHATLQSAEKSSGKPVSQYVELTFDLSDSPADTEGQFHSSARFGKHLPDFLNVEGNYTFHARARYGRETRGMRELIWSLHVDVGIDPDRTTVTSVPLGPQPDGRDGTRVTFTPKDRYGNLVGPGRGDDLTVGPNGASVPVGPVIDLGDGSYQVDLVTDSDAVEPPSMSVSQPGRPPVTVRPKEFSVYVYSVAFVCGEQKDCDCRCATLVPGHYATEINILNRQDRQVPVLIRPISLVKAGATIGREPGAQPPSVNSALRLAAASATMIDCCRLSELVLGAAPSAPFPLGLGVVEIASLSPLSVTAVYTAGGGGAGNGHAPSIAVEAVEARVTTF